MNTTTGNTKIYANILGIVVGFLILFLILNKAWMLYFALVVGLLSLTSGFLAEKISTLWMGLAHLLGLVVPKIILTLIFFLILFPIALLSRLFGPRDPLQLKNSRNSTFKEVKRTFDSSYFEKPW